jgi:hypothetical protein
MKIRQIIPLVLFLAVVGFTSCKDDDQTTTSSIVNFTATLNGASETPADTSKATGTGTFKYDRTTYMLSGSVTFSGMTATASHIHKGAVGVAGQVVIPLDVTAPVTSPITLAPTLLDSTQRADLMNGLYYVNIHSTAFPAGEIRGQLVKK